MNTHSPTSTSTPDPAPASGPAPAHVPAPQPTLQGPLTRRHLLGLGAATATTLGLAACGVSPQQTGQGSPEGTIRFAWWGNDSRQKIFTEFAGGFDGGTVKVEPSEYSGYGDRLSVQAAGKNLPDVLWMPANLALTYATRGALYDLGTLPEGTIDYSAFDPQVVESWKLGGKQYGPVYSQYSTCTQVDTTAMAAVGIQDLPDDESWTWDDLSTLAADYARAKGEGNWGIANQSTFYQHAHLWIRQQGAEVFTPDGKIGFDVDVLGSWFAWWQKATDAGGVMPTQISAGKTQWTQTGGKTALYLVQLNQFQDNASFSGENELQLVKSPVAAGAAPDYQFKYYTRLCSGANTTSPELAGQFINFSLNDPSNADVVGLASGIPSNPEIVAAIKAAADPTAMKILEMTDRIDEQPMRARPEPPVGGANWQTLVEKAGDDIFNGGVAIDAAVQEGIATLQAALDKG
ncbi:ABC transporter substrate-binding protein [Kineococcus radiotolerans]|uniref:Extracellular solute-binding protein family 1 n=1 Tax=Kineococcus radiotolerans (strain ATCC BAA-149 / DSM 14245 / SRS30216) TaxID=266940 RepID=A6WA70_KINRD|nr:extracellular solute-binding protein [Kineococcus radiotolerans]ABS03709.1 extracellular solute-binding protein family 1 [Kineococcus radiotolerans SRS30216 = ATCC BAA-149]